MRRNVLRLLATLLVMLGLLALGGTPAIAQEEFTIHVTIDQATINQRTGEVTLTGTATCSGPRFFFIEIHGQLFQGPKEFPDPRHVFAPFSALVAPCPNPEGVTFSETFTAVTGRLHPGRARLSAGAVGCEPIFPTSFCEARVSQQLDTTIRLTPAR